MSIAETEAIASEIDLLRRVYAAFNRREIEMVLAEMHPDVDWPNGWEGGRVRGTAAVRDYWTRQFQALNPRVERRSSPQSRMAASR
jgi:ketosteroid isomerase-like protein